MPSSRQSVTRVEQEEDRSAKTARLLRAAAGTECAEERETLLNEVIVINMCVAQAVCRRYRGKGIAEEDLEQVAYVALVRSAHRFDPAVGSDFLSYAIPNISGEVKRYFRDHGWTVRPPRRVQEAQTRMRALTADGGRGTEMTAEEIAARLGMSGADVREAMAATGCFRPASTDTCHPETGIGLLDTLGEVCADYATVEDRDVLRRACCGLSARDRQILVLRFYEEKTQQEIADRIGVTQMQVSRLLARILRDLRQECRDTSETTFASTQTKTEHAGAAA